MMSSLILRRSIFLARARTSACGQQDFGHGQGEGGRLVVAQHKVQVQMSTAGTLGLATA